jgi:hypothetical protein
VDLVIMGTKGATGAREILFGSNAVHVIKNSNCPVLVIPPTTAIRSRPKSCFPPIMKSNTPGSFWRHLQKFNGTTKAPFMCCMYPPDLN